ncbi:MAG: hypothetical protein DDT19_02764 [Syntrophomonadaceae bacterium]|nr:hypothetical protein [Bacillota bacterium]
MGVLEHRKRDIGEENKENSSPHPLSYFRDIVSVLLNDTDIWVDDLIDIINEESKERFVREGGHPKE